MTTQVCRSRRVVETIIAIRRRHQLVKTDVIMIFHNKFYILSHLFNLKGRTIDFYFITTNMIKTFFADLF